MAGSGGWDKGRGKRVAGSGGWDKGKEIVEEKLIRGRDVWEGKGSEGRIREQSN